VYFIGVYLIGVYFMGVYFISVYSVPCGYKPYRRDFIGVCEGKPGVYSAIWCLCYRTSKMKETERKGANSRVK
jgi:hypothetical protein